MFDDLPPSIRVQAQRIFSRLCSRWRGDLPSWRMALLVGRARWLAMHPPDSAWGRRMLAKRGGKARQRQAGLEVYGNGLTLQQWATLCRVAQHRAVLRAQQPGFRRVAYTLDQA